MIELLPNLLVLGAVAVASYTDVRTRRIPNRLTVPLAVAGLGLNVLLAGRDGLVLSATGWMLGLGLLFPLFLLRAMGAGDVKLMAALGALKGPEFVFFVCLWSAVAAGLVALAGLLRSRRLGLALANMYYTSATFLFLKTRTFGEAGGSLVSAGRIPYAPAIAFGAVMALGGVRWIGG
jgi:prepilin peptidase CpaA